MRRLQHRQLADLESVPKRLGWLTWEDCNRLHRGACPWLQHGKPEAEVSG